MNPIEYDLLISIDPRLAEWAFAARTVGSTYIYGHGEDLDLLVLVRTPVGMSSLVNSWYHPDFKYGGSGPKSGDNWCSWKRGTLNLLLTDDEDLYDRWLMAAEVCRYLHLAKGVVLTKPERIAIHDIIMEGKFCKDFGL